MGIVVVVIFIMGIGAGVAHIILDKPEFVFPVGLVLGIVSIIISLYGIAKVCNSWDGTISDDDTDTPPPLPEDNPPDGVTISKVEKRRQLYNAVEKIIERTEHTRSRR